MKHCILVTGGNAAGKTTTVQKALAPWVNEDNLTVTLDSRIMSVRADNDGRFKGEADNQRQVLTEVWLSDVPVIVVEGTRINTPLVDVAKKNPEARELTVLLALQSPEVMRKHLMDRCAKKGKQFQAGYWDYGKCRYEGMMRYANNFSRHGIRPRTFQIDEAYTKCDEIVAAIQEKIREALG